MGRTLGFKELKKLTSRDQRLLLTLTSYVLVLVIYINLSSFKSLLVGIAVSILYLLINAALLGDSFFGKEDLFARLLLGLLLVIGLLGFVGWLVLVTYNLDTLRVVLVLFGVATMSFFSNKWMRHKDVI